jgi:flagellum-specific peptidoglycan hydrolase FlgJ
VVPDEDLEEEIHQTFATHKELATSLKNHLAATVFPRIEKQQRARGGKGSSHPSNRRTKANNPKESPKEEGEEETTEWQSAAARTSSNRTQQSHSPSPNGKKSTSKAAKLEAMSINEFMEYLKAHVIDNSKVYPLTPIKDLVIISNSNLEGYNTTNTNTLIFRTQRHLWIECRRLRRINIK